MKGPLEPFCTLASRSEDRRQEIKQIYPPRDVAESFAAGPCAELADVATKGQIAAEANAYGMTEDAGITTPWLRARHASALWWPGPAGNAFVGQSLTFLHNRIALLRLATLHVLDHLAASASEI